MSYDPSANPNQNLPVPPENIEQQHQQPDESAKIEIAYVDEDHQLEHVEDGSSNPTLEGESSEHTTSPNNDAPDQAVISDDQIGPDYIRNKDKAEEMARAQNDAIDENHRLEQQGKYGDMLDDVEWPAEFEGREYEVRNALAKYAQEGVNTPEEALRLAKHDCNMFLNYGHAIAENHRKHGDKLSLELQAIDKVFEFREKILKVGGDKLWAAQAYMVSTLEKATIKTANGYYGDLDVLLIRDYGKEWSLSMFDDGEYKVTNTEFDPEGEFQETRTTKKRNITEADVAHLEETLNGCVEDHKRQLEAEKSRKYFEDLEEYEDNHVSTGEILQRAQKAMGNTEQAREAARDFPGDFM